MADKNKSCIWPTFFNGYITGIVESCVLFDSFPKENLSQLLPTGYKLAEQSIAPSGKHPIYWCFNVRQQKVGTPVPFLCLNYSEFAFVIPFIECTNEKNLVGAYVPTLYLNSLSGVLGGRFFYQLNKQLKKCIVTSESSNKIASGMSIEGLFRQKEILFTTYIKAGAPLPYQECENFIQVKPMLDQKLLTHGLWGFKSSSFTMDYDELNITPLSGTIKTFDFLKGIEHQERKIPSIEESVLGGFHFKTNWRLDLPKT